MSEDDFRDAARFHWRTAYAAYQAMPTPELWRQLQQGMVDQTDLTTPEAIAFGAGRLALLAEVLTRREPTRSLRIPILLVGES